MNRAYRSELDGLRAIAVLSVVIYHAHLTFNGILLFQGGFLGVDIFFVLSGFLITGILIDKSPTLFAFYKSRIDRIYPALLLMLLLSCIFAFIFLIPSDLLNFREQLKGAVAFYSNYIFMFEDSYVADSSQYKVLLHTWSLGIEWQYYLAFPFIIYAIKRFFSSQFEQVLILLFAISFFYSLYLMQINNTFAFYSTFSRVWELFAGGIVFLISKHLKDGKVDNFLSAFGLVIIIYCLIFFKDTDAHPGFISLIAVFGTTLFILFTKEDSLIYKLSTLKISIFFGVISYSLYLYHQPILVFYRFSQGEIGNKAFIVLFLLMVLISYLSYNFFENPIRRSKNNKKYFILLFFILAIIAFYKGAKYTEGYKFRQSQEVKEALKHFEVTENVRLYGNTNGYNFKGDEISQCERRMPQSACKFFGDKNAKNLVIVGDSFSGVFTNSLQKYVPKISLTTFHNSSSPLLADPIYVDDGFPELWETNKARWKEFEKMQPANVLIGTYFGGFWSAKKSVENFKFGESNSKEEVAAGEIFKSFRKSVEKLLALGHNPIILLQPPSPKIDIAKEMKRQINSGVLSFKENYQATSNKEVDDMVREVLKGLNVTFIDLNARMCKDTGECLTFNEKGALYNNGPHLSYFGVQLFVDDVINSLK